MFFRLTDSFLSKIGILKVYESFLWFYLFIYLFVYLFIYLFIQLFIEHQSLVVDTESPQAKKLL
jgi:hypothetical protein